MTDKKDSLPVILNNFGYALTPHAAATAKIRELEQQLSAERERSEGLKQGYNGALALVREQAEELGALRARVKGLEQMLAESHAVIRAQTELIDASRQSTATPTQETPKWLEAATLRCMQWKRPIRQRRQPPCSACDGTGKERFRPEAPTTTKETPK